MTMRKKRTPKTGGDEAQRIDDLINLASAGTDWGVYEARRVAIVSGEVFFVDEGLCPHSLRRLGADARGLVLRALEEMGVVDADDARDYRRRAEARERRARGAQALSDLKNAADRLGYRLEKKDE